MPSPQSPAPALPRIGGGNPQPPASPGGVKVCTPHLVPQSSRHHQRDWLSKRLPLEVNRTIVRETRRLQPTKKQFFVSAWHSPPLSPKSSAQSGQQIRPSPRLSTKEVCLPAADVSRRKAQRSQRTPHPPPPSGTLLRVSGISLDGEWTRLAPRLVWRPPKGPVSHRPALKVKEASMRVSQRTRANKEAILNWLST